MLHEFIHFTSHLSWCKRSKFKVWWLSGVLDDCRDSIKLFVRLYNENLRFRTIKCGCYGFSDKIVKNICLNMLWKANQPNYECMSVKWYEWEYACMRCASARNSFATHKRLEWVKYVYNLPAWANLCIRSFSKDFVYIAWHSINSLCWMQHFSDFVVTDLWWK